MPTHEVVNTPPRWRDVNLFRADQALAGRVGGDHAALNRLGELAGTERAQDWGRVANAVPPVLRTHDRYGHRIDEVEFHPAWHELMTVAVGAGLHAAPWRADTACRVRVNLLLGDGS